MYKIFAILRLERYVPSLSETLYRWRLPVQEVTLIITNENMKMLLTKFKLKN